mgnify:FL=1
MLDGMHFRRIHHRLLVGTGHAQIEGGDDFCTDVILTGYIDTGLQFDMVNGEAGYFFHKILHSAPCSTFAIALFLCIVYTNFMEKEIVGKRKAFMKHSAEYYIEHLEMEPHVEGGYFKECLLEKEDRDLWSSIYFMLAKGEVSHFHRLKSDEVWYYHDGNALTIYMIDEEGKLTAAKLGLDLEKGEVPQVLVPKGMIFGSAMEEEGFSLVGCMVSPCFKYEEFELFDRKELLEKYPEHREVILRLTRE